MRVVRLDGRPLTLWDAFGRAGVAVSADAATRRCRDAVLDIIFWKRHHIVMRTTLAIDDDVLDQVKRLAKSRSTSLGKMATDLLRRALETDCPTRTVHGLTVLDPGPHSTTVSASAVRRLLEDEV